MIVALSTRRKYSTRLCKRKFLTRVREEREVLSVDLQMLSGTSIPQQVDEL